MQVRFPPLRFLTVRLSLVGLGSLLIACGSPYGQNDPLPLVSDETSQPGPGSTAPTAPSTQAPAPSACNGPCMTQLSAGNEFVCALGDDAKVRCWGNNDKGQTGSNEAGSVAVPSVVNGLGNIKKISTGNAHACALDDQGVVKCWGDDTDGLVSGVPSTSSHPSPTVVRGFPATVLSLAAVSSSECAILVNNDLWCWGDNEYGQLGLAGSDPTHPPKVVPSPIKTMSNVDQVGASEQTLCVRHNTGVVQCLGRDFSGNLGNSTSDLDPHATPVTVIGLPGVVSQMAAGTGFHLAVALDNGHVAAWGSNARQAIVADGSIFQVTSPRDVAGVSDVAEVAAGGYFTCARKKADGSVSCWGDASVGQAGLPPKSGQNLPPTKVNGLPPVQSLTAGRSGFACAISAGVAYCWGANDKGQLGRGSVGDPKETPSAVKL